MLITRGAVALKSPYHFFLQTVPSPPRQWTKVGKTATCGSRKTGHEVRLKWMPSELGCKDTAFILPRFEATLRGLYWRKIALPADESNLASYVLSVMSLPVLNNVAPSLQPKEYLSALLQPVADLCNQLHLPHVLRKPMRSVSVRLCDSEYHLFSLTYANVSSLIAAIYGATFVAEDLDRWKEGVPFIVSVVCGRAFCMRWTLTSLLTSPTLCLKAMGLCLSPLRKHSRRQWNIVPTHYQS